MDDEEEDRQKVAFEIAERYEKGCARSPKARVTFWYECRRALFPRNTFPASRDSHRVSTQDSDALHALFEANDAPIVVHALAHAMANWISTDAQGRAPSIDRLADSEIFELAMRRWIADMKADQRSVAEIGLINVRGFGAWSH